MSPNHRLVASESTEDARQYSIRISISLYSPLSKAFTAMPCFMVVDMKEEFQVEVDQARLGI